MKLPFHKYLHLLNEIDGASPCFKYRKPPYHSSDETAGGQGNEELTAVIERQTDAIVFPWFPEAVRGQHYIRDEKQLENVLGNHKPDIVFHLAAQPIVRLSYENRS